MRLTERDRHLLSVVSDREALTRQQLSRALGFGSVTRANAVLLRLVRHGYLDRRFQARLHGGRRCVYVLGPTGWELLAGGRQQDRIRYKSSSDLFLEHRLAINDVWLAFTKLARPNFELSQWLPTAAFAKSGLGVLPDAYLEYRLETSSYSAFLEADLGTETLRRIDGKVRSYMELAFTGRFERLFARRFFRVLIVTDTVGRLANLRRTVARQTDKIFWLTTREQLVASGPFSPVWQRPKDATLQSLTQS